ncbi:exonuclease SbcCD subunit D [Zhihengliuella salsuginis]|uniref:Nuclease SbcCD subunit D n=1 Tax=Zhihengliuella salsuginis TaxID=578222 RepID=A0ABQ3GI77_9MICC|nr:exonuclease SbcCD subunit D [Zhihengliuella salsuginis]GHD08431.1 nuclease SbcCD subunit D [Zhihengliuella salsuginis]
MKILHTSDWHLGRSFHGAGLESAQLKFIDELVACVEEDGVDVVLISGDVYDRAMPGVDVVGLFDEALIRLREAGAQVVVTSGNHDSAIRLGFGARLMRLSGVHVRTAVAAAAEPVVFDAPDHQVAVYPVPYLEPRMVREELGVEAPGHPPVVNAVLERIREDLERRRREGSAPIVSVVMAHVFATGAEPSESERDLSIGGVDNVPVDYFGDFDYAALGHLHGRQRLAGNVRYSGSPIAYSFSEVHHRKGAWLVETGADGVVDVSARDWTPERRLATLRGDLEDLLADAAHAEAEAAYCQVTLTDPERPARALERVRGRFPHLLVLRFEPRGRQDAAASYADRVRRARNPIEVTGDFVDHVRRRRLDEAEQDVVAAAFAAVREGRGEA